MSFIAVAIGGSAIAGIGGAIISSNASSKASQQQAALGQQALGQQNALFQRGADATQPFIDAGKGVLPTLTSLLTPGENQTNILSQLPGFKFAQDWGQKAVANLGSTLGFGGNTLKAGADYATGTAQQGFGSLINMLQAYANTGASAAGSLFGNATQTGANTGNTLTGIGNAQAAGTLGSANALANGLGSTANSFTNGLLLNKLLGKGVGGDTSQAMNGSGVYSGDPTIAGFGPTYG